MHDGSSTEYTGHVLLKNVQLSMVQKSRPMFIRFSLGQSFTYQVKTLLINFS
jgi:hypothetical protein